MRGLGLERVADYIIRKINEAGAGHIFMITGRGILYLTDAVARNNNITPVSTYHEQGASYAAMAYASSTNGISACLVSTGCAATNAVTACLCAYQDNLPVVFISGNHMRNENTRYTGAPIRTYGSQEADIIGIVDSITKYAVMLVDKDRVAYEVEKALSIALDGRKGPVWIDIPLDVQNMRINEEELEHYNQIEKPGNPSQEDIDFVLKALNRAKRPVLLIGGGVASSGAEKDVRSLVEKINIPVVYSPTASDIYGTSHELSIGSVGSLGGSRAGNFAVQNADFLLTVGTKLCSQETGEKANFARVATLAVVDIDENEHTKDGVEINRLIHSDAKEFFCRLINSNIETVSKEWIDRCKHWKELFSIRNEIFEKELKARDEIDLYSLMDLISEFLPDDATVITDAGFEELIVPSAIRYRDNQRCFFPAAQGAMGYAIPAILGAYFSGRGNIVCVVGDGSIMMNMQELGIIKAYNIPVKILVINNNMYSVIRKRQTDLFKNRTIGNDPTDGVPAPNFKLIAGSVGINYRKIVSLSELESNVKSMFADDCETILYEILSTPDQKYFHESYALTEKRKLVHRPIEDLSPFLDRDVFRNEMIVEPLE